MKSLSPTAKYNLQRILPFGIIWLFLAIIFFIVEIGVTGTIPKGNETRIDLTPKVLFFALVSITFIGLLIGTIELFYLNQRFAQKSFAQKILYKFLFYSLLFSVITLITYPIAASIELGASILDPKVWTKFTVYLTSWTNISSLMQLASMLLISLFYAEISENIGHGVLLNFFTGKYHTPKEERRIFMFVDMKSSTTIAEKIGHTKYFELLKAYYRDLSPAIVKHSGEIYQYVGDEIVITWPLKRGVQNNRCLECFFAMKKDLLKKASFYQEQFHTTPSFKAGMHEGIVTTGEIGVVKQEIIFTGDVLNTTARIQSLCNDFETELLISENLKKGLSDSDKLTYTPLGNIELKGKATALQLFKVSERTNG